MEKIILASASPRRRKLLQLLNLPFEVIASGIEEIADPRLPPPQIVRSLAERKAAEVASGVSGALVIGADTIVALNETVLEKPSDGQHAVEMLQSLSGKTHQVFTGVALYRVDAGQNITGKRSFYERTDVTFGPLDENDINAYVAGGSPMDKAGGYGIQDDFGAIFVKAIKGDYYNVVGFPLYRFYQTMKTFAPQFLGHAN